MSPPSFSLSLTWAPSQSHHTMLLPTLFQIALVHICRYLKITLNFTYQTSQSVWCTWINSLCIFWVSGCKFVQHFIWFCFAPFRWCLWTYIHFLWSHCILFSIMLRYNFRFASFPFLFSSFSQRVSLSLSLVRTPCKTFNWFMFLVYIKPFKTNELKVPAMSVRWNIWMHYSCGLLCLHRVQCTECTNTTQQWHIHYNQLIIKEVPNSSEASAHTLTKCTMALAYSAAIM